MWNIRYAHKWIIQPYTAYEIRRELRVRQCRQTAIAWDKKYYDVDSGTLIFDKLHTLNHISWCDLVEPEEWDIYNYIKPKKYPSAWFVPKDDDFDNDDEDMTKDETLKLIREEQCQLLKEIKREMNLYKELVDKTQSKKESNVKEELWDSFVKDVGKVFAGLEYRLRAVESVSKMEENHALLCRLASIEARITSIELKK